MTYSARAHRDVDDATLCANRVDITSVYTGIILVQMDMKIIIINIDDDVNVVESGGARYTNEENQRNNE
jgi:hypothetical protein